MMKNLIFVSLLVVSSLVHAEEKKFKLVQATAETWVFKCTPNKEDKHVISGSKSLVVEFNDTITEKETIRIASWNGNYNVPMYFTGSAANDNGHMSTSYVFANISEKGDLKGESLVIDHTPREKLITYTLSSDKTLGKDGKRSHEYGVCEVTDHIGGR